MLSAVYKSKIGRLSFIPFRTFISSGRDVDQNVFPHLETLQKELIAGGAYLNPTIEIDFLHKYGLGLVCRKKLKKYEVIAKIPYSLCTPSSSIDELAVNVHKEFTDKTPKKVLSPHLKYLKYMYQYGNMPSVPISWRDDLETQAVNAFYPAFEPDEMLAAIREKKAFYREVAKTHKFKVDPFLLNVGLVESRLFHLEEGGLEPQVMGLLIETEDMGGLVTSMSQDYEGVIQRYADKIDHETVSRKPGAELLIPFVDFVNHGKRDDALVIFNQTKNEFHLVAMRDLPSGGQIFFDYSTRCDALSLYMQYGIAPPRQMRNRDAENQADGRTEQEIRQDEKERKQEEERDLEAAAKRQVIEVISFIAEYRRLNGKGDRFLPM